MRLVLDCAQHAGCPVLSVHGAATTCPSPSPLLRLDLRTWSGNHGMMALARKLGFQEEARFHKARMVEGTVYDGMGYGVLREEWAVPYPYGFAASLH